MPGVSLEIAVKIALVGEVEIIDQLLETLVCVHKCNLQLNYRVVVNYLLGVLPAGTLAHRVKVACGDSHLVGIELYRPLGAEIVGEQHSELIEKFILVLAYVLF